MRVSTDGPAGEAWEVRKRYTDFAALDAQVRCVLPRDSFGTHTLANTHTCHAREAFSGRSADPCARGAFVAAVTSMCVKLVLCQLRKKFWYDRKLPPLPPKNAFAMQLDQRFIEARRVELNRYMSGLLGAAVHRARCYPWL